VRKFVKAPVLAYKPKKGRETDPEIALILERGMRYVNEFAAPEGGAERGWTGRRRARIASTSRSHLGWPDHAIARRVDPSRRAMRPPDGSRADGEPADCLPSPAAFKSFSREVSQHRGRARISNATGDRCSSRLR